MIHVVYGNDLDEKSIYIKNQTSGSSVVRIPSNHLSLDLLSNYAEQNSLFQEEVSVLLENPISESSVVFDKEILERLKDSATLFIFTEDALLAEELKKYKKYAENIEKFEIVKVEKKENPFILANLFGSRDKTGTWSVYRKLVEKGSGGESLAGMLFWKVKSLILSGSDKFTEDELKKQSSELVDIYHKSHLGLLDMDIALEQFILKNL